MEAGAKGCEIEISGKLTSERARTEKFVAGTMVHTGDPAYELVRKGFDIAIKKLGVYGVSVRIIPPDVELPDEFKVKEVSKEELEALKAQMLGEQAEAVQTEVEAAETTEETKAEEGEKQ
jgi:small subunit ribosomal protein S3